MDYVKHQGFQQREGNAQLNAEIVDRLVRLETRLVQLMYFLGADPTIKYDKRNNEKRINHGN